MHEVNEPLPLPPVRFRFTLQRLLIASVPIALLLASYRWLGVEAFMVWLLAALVGLSVWGWFFAPKRQGWGIVCTLPLLGLFCCVPGLGHPRWTYWRTHCSSNIKQIALAIQNYESTNKVFPA